MIYRKDKSIIMKHGNLRSRRDEVGWIFILPWVIGFLFFFLQPLVSLLWYSFTDFVLIDGGYELKKLDNGMFMQYVRALTEDARFPRLLLEAVSNLAYQVPIVVFFSLFMASLLNRKFHGRMVMRTIFFLPIIITSGVLAELIRSDVGSFAPVSTNRVGNIFDVSVLSHQLLESGLPAGITNILTGLAANVADLIWTSGIQILIFIAALLAIPPSYYEVAQVEGASGWETFWKVTFPIVSPFILVNLIYSIVDSFTVYSNEVMRYITVYFNRDLDYSYAAAMSWIYFATMLIILGIVFLAFRRSVFYSNE